MEVGFVMDRAERDSLLYHRQISLIEGLVKFLTTQVSRPIKKKESDDREMQNMRNVKIKG